MTTVTLTGISKQFSNVTAMQDVSFEVEDGEFFVLLGPTGAGKTTTLRVIAGLEKPDAGHLYFDGQLADNFTPAARDVAFVFQQYSLYPTMTVYENLAFPLKSPMRKLPKDQIETRVTEAAKKLRISHLLQRKTGQLSGGEMQRVSIGRAIVRQPKIYLMDEPLSNLDAKLREALRVELQHLQKTQDSATLFVTHDQIEALTMADRIAVMQAGKIVQIGKPDDIYDRPATTYVAQLVGTPRINLLPSTRDNGKLHINDTPLQLSANVPDLPQSFLLGIRPEDVTPDPEGNFTGSVALTEPLGVETIVHIKTGQQTLLSLVPGMTNLQVGNNIRFSIAQNRLHYFNLQGKRVSA